MNEALHQYFHPSGAVGAGNFGNEQGRGVLPPPRLSLTMLTPAPPGVKFTSPGPSTTFANSAETACWLKFSITTLSSVIGQLPGVPEGRGVAVALEGEVVPRAAWQRTILEEGSRIEIVVAVQGG